MRKGFTLVELLIVVAIIGVLAMITIPAYLGVQTRSQRAAITEDCKALRTELDSMLKAVYAPSPPLVKGTVDWNGDGIIDLNDVTPSGTSASDIVNHITSSSYHFKPKNPYGSGNAFDEGLIKLIPGNRKITIKGYSKEGILLYSATAMSY